MIQEAVRQMVKDKITPGVVFLTWARGEVVCEEIFGSTKYQDEGAYPVTRNTIYDIASITKIIVATATIMLVDREAASLDDTVGKFLPACKYGEVVTIRHLLTHTSSIAIQMSKLTQLENSERMLSAIFNAPLNGEPGRVVMFTNVNSFLLGKIIEVVSKESLNQFLNRELFIPLSMQDTFFNPLPHLKNRIAPTEIVEGRGLIQGEVHDESAYALGGMVGHSGLFSTVDDLYKFCQLWLQKGTFNNRYFFGEALAQEATQNLAPVNSPATGLGWMINRSWMGQLGPMSFGHTAFTGPSIMITPHYHFISVLLTNRTYPHQTDKDRHSYQAKIMNILNDKLAG